ncbi:MAG: U32 family peptidase [Desulfobacterales bacterium]|nr:U32 family peptidase [Desulfobacterales bacterium]
MKNKQVELLSPAGNFEKLEIAIHYRTNAVYLGGKNFSLRNYADNFTISEMKEAVKLSHKHNVKVYLACNIYLRNNEIQEITSYLEEIKSAQIDIDGLIVSDPAVIMECKKILPHIDLHLSTQSNTTNFKTAAFWKELGITRINTARELSLKEIKEISEKVDIEIESFVHGAMCISYSGRCLLSGFMTNRDSNRGLCSQPCRWKYSVVEEFRPNRYYPIVEDERGSYIFNSKDICMVEHIDLMIQSGIDSLKIEGRMKGINYLASAVKIYRDSIDAYYLNPESFKPKKEWLTELESINTRGYSTGFYLGDPKESNPNYAAYKPLIVNTFIGKVMDSIDKHHAKVKIKNKTFTGDNVIVLSNSCKSRYDKIIKIIDKDGLEIPFSQPGSEVIIKFHEQYFKNDIIRRPELP